MVQECLPAADAQFFWDGLAAADSYCNQLFGKCLGNDFDVLGRNLMDHCYRIRASAKFDGFQDSYSNVRVTDSHEPPSRAIHEMGTARMGRDPKTSMLNARNQPQAVPNVSVTDGSAVVSGACQNPSVTYMALTARAADFAVESLKKRTL